MELFRFEHSGYFYTLLLIPVITAIFIWMLLCNFNQQDNPEIRFNNVGLFVPYNCNGQSTNRFETGRR